MLINTITNFIELFRPMKPIDVKSNYYAEYNVDSNEKDPKFKEGDHVKIWKYKHIFAKEYTPNWSEEDFVVSKIKRTVPWTYVIANLNGEKTLRIFYEKEWKKLIKKNLK